jgi:nitronate monooxygenase
LAKNPDLLSVALDRHPRAFFLSFGDLRPFAGKVARAGVPLIGQVQTVADARAAVNEGVRIVVAQGTEAGGHGGVRATMALVPRSSTPSAMSRWSRRAASRTAAVWRPP